MPSNTACSLAFSISVLARSLESGARLPTHDPAADI
jgi:hypothetical protein